MKKFFRGTSNQEAPPARDPGNSRIAYILSGGPIYVSGALVALAIILICFLSARRPGMEEVGVFNAVYTYAHYGKMTFPIYGLNYFESFGIHPHLHYAILGLLIRLGL